MTSSTTSARAHWRCDLTTRMRVMQEETFGPVLPVAVVAVGCAALVKPRKEVEGLWLRDEGLKIKGLPISAPSPQG